MIYDVEEFGALSGVEALQTEAIQAACNKCRDAGGGTVNIPPGIFRTGTVRLYSNTTLNLEPGAVLLGPDSIDDYSPIPFAWELYPYTYSVIYAMDAENISITGKGTIDFNGRAFVVWDDLITGLPADKAELLTDELKKDCHYAMPPRDKRPNRLMFFHNCRNVELSGISLKDAPTWGAVFSSCKQLRVHNVNIDNHMQVPNSDGIHCCGCKDVIISGCVISSGDDCIAITGIADYNEVTERIVISDCVFRSASSAVRIGFMESKIKNVSLSNITIHDSNRGIAIFAGTKGRIENVSITNIQVSTRLYAGPWWGKGEPLVICAVEPDSEITGVTVSNVKTDSENSIIALGCKDLKINDLSMTLGYGNARPLYGARLDLAPHDSRPAPEADKCLPWLIADHVENLITNTIRVERKPGETKTFDTKELIS